MATLHRLLESNILDEIVVPLEDGEFPSRWFYCFPEFRRWMNEELPKLKTGRLKSTESPREQFDNILYRWTSGKTIKYDKVFKDLMPRRDEVWEMKTVDLRLFGWMCQPRKYIAVFGDYADLYKSPSMKASYGTALSRVLRARARLNLDEPKYCSGVFDDLVCV